jgi:hypothetical protein
MVSVFEDYPVAGKVRANAKCGPSEVKKGHMVIQSVCQFKFD